MPAPLPLTCGARVSAGPRTVSPPSLETNTERQLLPNSRRYASGPKPTTPPLHRTCPAAPHQPGIATAARSPRSWPPRFPAPAPINSMPRAPRCHLRTLKGPLGAVALALALARRRPELDAPPPLISAFTASPATSTPSRDESRKIIG